VENKLATITNLKDRRCLPQSNLGNEAATHLCEPGGGIVPWRLPQQRKKARARQKKDGGQFCFAGSVFDIYRVTRVLVQENAPGARARVRARQHTDSRREHGK
jgi:hypothetical protein